MAVKHKTALAGHTAGIFADMTLDGPEIGTLVAVVDRAKNLPNRKTMGKQDPYCAMRLGKDAKKTDTDRRGGQTPKWDQELRFTVHESPDYYRLKCSVFNDDKKTDLIGEAWINLSELIKPGGGSNDLWHQLNYKGKYAGDIRVELTYYDMRPREEKPLEKRRPREKVPSVSAENVTAAATPRQLGPREVRRRPLPASPAGTNSPVPGPTQQPPIAKAQEVSAPPAPPPKIPLNEPEKTYPSPQGQKIEEEQYALQVYARDRPTAQPLVQYRQPFCEDQSPMADYEEEPSWTGTHNYSQEYSHNSPHSSMVPSPSSLPPRSWSGEADEWGHENRRSSQQYADSDNAPYSKHRGLPCPPDRAVDSQYHASRSNASPSKSTPFRDSPLRQSYSQQGDSMHMMEEPDTYDTPPPPPMHRETTPRRQYSDHPTSSSSQHEYSMVPFTSQQIDVTQKRMSIDARSPLQHHEYDYGHDSYSRRQAPAHNSPDVRDYSSRQRSSETLTEDQRLRDSDWQHRMPEQPNPYDARSSHAYNNLDQGYYSHENSYDGNLQDRAYDRPEPSGRSSSYDKRLSNVDPNFFDYQSTGIHHSHSQPTLHQSDIYKPQPVRPRPSDSQTPQRKPVSPAPHPQDSSRRLSAVPFGPDAYNVLNPASSPVTNNGTIFQTPEQAREASRLHEVNKMRDQGPIIGNDGRVIDPSDHLPSDTWAPEPERKTRRPEHVVHIRTKNDPRSQPSPQSLPTSARAEHYRQSTTQASSSSSSPISAPPSGGRNKLQKSNAARPLPTQPYPQPRPEPRSDSVQHSRAGSQQALQRSSYQDVSPAIQRPQLSEYQVPAGNSYSPRGVSFQDDRHSTPTKAQTHTGRGYDPRNSNPYNDPLAAEMSMIDIGPSRGGQMVLTRRDY